VCSIVKRFFNSSGRARRACFTVVVSSAYAAGRGHIRPFAAEDEPAALHQVAKSLGDFITFNESVQYARRLEPARSKCKVTEGGTAI